MAILWVCVFCRHSSVHHSAVQWSAAAAVSELVMLWSEPLVCRVCCSENECNKVKVLIVCTCATQTTVRFTFGFLVPIPGEQRPFYLLHLLEAKTSGRSK